MLLSSAYSKASRPITINILRRDDLFFSLMHSRSFIAFHVYLLEFFIQHSTAGVFTFWLLRSYELQILLVFPKSEFLCIDRSWDNVRLGRIGLVFLPFT